VFLTFIHVPHDGSAKPKHVAYWHNFRTNGIVHKQMHTMVCLTVFIIIVIILIVVFFNCFANNEGIT
jgi:hypothetical protein